MSSVSFPPRSRAAGNGGLERTSQILDRIRLAPRVGNRRLRKAEMIEGIRMRRQSARQNLGFSSRPFVLCGLPVKCPPTGTLVHERRNGQFVLLVTGHPNYGLPWGQDRLVPLFLATLAARQRSRRITFASAAEMLDTFGMQQGGSQYRQLVAAFQRIFGATIFFGTDTRRSISPVVHEARFHFMSEARIWYSRDPSQQSLSGDCQNLIVLTEEFYQEILEHPIPIDLDAAKALSSSPAALDLFTWLSYRCFVAKSEERISLFGEFGLANQLGCGYYSRPRRFRERLEQWLTLVHVMWPECPARISQDGSICWLIRRMPFPWEVV
jgi:Plasmid encoded RepA protein